ncbi:MAG: hypothetical protein ACTHOH_12440 [Lysobacteraceae bacterium]
MPSTLALGLMVAAAVLSGRADAAPVPNGGGAGYHAQVFYTDGRAAGISPRSTWNECNQQLNATIQYDTTQRGYTVVKVVPCHYTGGPLSGIDAYDHRQDFALPIRPSTPRESAVQSALLLERIRKLREAYRIDACEASLRTILDAAAK